MSNEESPDSSRRDFLTGKTLRSKIEQAGDAIADGLKDAESPRVEPTGGDTLRLVTRAMACEFAVAMNPGPAEQIDAASEALEHVHELEAQMSVYRDDSELSQLNRQAADSAVTVEPRLFDLLCEAQTICRETESAFDPTSGPLLGLWKMCRGENRIPTDGEIATALENVGIDHVQFDSTTKSVGFEHAGVGLDLGGIGKGHALDRAAEILKEREIENWLFHGGHSSILASGDHNNQGGWPVGIRNPLFPTERLATILLSDCAFSASGSGVQHFRHEGKRYGHILDPRTGWPVEEMLSVVVLAPTAALADALSTAFFVAGVENAQKYCDNRSDVHALLIPAPRRGRTLEPINCGIPAEVLFYTSDDITPGGSDACLT